MLEDSQENWWAQPTLQDFRATRLENKSMPFSLLTAAIEQMHRIRASIMVAALIVPGIAVGGEDSPTDREFLAGMEAAKRGDTSKAIELFSAVIRSTPSYSEAYFNRGLLKYRQREFEASADDFAKAISLKQGDASYYLAQGNALDEINQLDAANRSLTEAIRLDPKYVDAFVSRSRVWARKLDNPKAIDDLDRAITLDPKSVQAHLNRGLIRWRMFEYEKSRADLEKTIELDPNNSEAVVWAAWLLSTCPEDQVLNGKRALELAKDGCRLTQWKNADAIAALAASHACVGNFEHAVLMQHKAISIAPEGDRDLYKSRLNLYKMKKPLR